MIIPGVGDQLRDEGAWCVSVVVGVVVSVVGDGDGDGLLSTGTTWSARRPSTREAQLPADTARPERPRPTDVAPVAVAVADDARVHAHAHAHDYAHVEKTSWQA